MLNELLESKVVAILRGIRPEEAIPFCEILAEEGVRFPEIPLNTPDALQMIAALAEHFRNTGVHVGAGTVLSPEAVGLAHRAGAEYIISPNTNPAVIRCTTELGMLSMPGVCTPTEAFIALEAGAHVLKLFPCGTPREIGILKSVVSQPVFAVGGIDADNKDSYLAVADGVGVGVGIFRPGIDAAELRRNIRKFMR